MNFWFALALGFIIGWLIEWLIDWFFWRAQWKALRADLETAQAENAALSGQRQRAFDLERQLAAAQEKLAAEQAARTAAEKQAADLTKFKTAAEADLAKLKAEVSALKAEVPTLQADLAAARAELAAARADNSRLAATAGTLAALELRYQTEANLRAAAETSEAQLRARVAALTNELTANDPLAGDVHFSAPMGDESDGLADRSALADAAQWEARLAELEAAANDPLAGGIHFSAPMGGEAQTDGQLIDLKLKLSETLPDDVSFGVSFTEDDGLADRSALADAAQWEARLAELEVAASDPLAGGVHFSAPLADESALNDLRDAHLAEMQAAIRLAAEAQAEADRLRARVAALTSELEAAANDPLAGGVHFSAPLGGDEATADPALERLQAELAYDRAAVNFAVQLDEEAAALRAQVAALTSALEAATNDPLAGGVHFSAPMGGAEVDGQLIDLKLKLSETLPDDVSFGVSFTEDDGLADRTALADAAQWEARLAELEAAASDPLAGGVHFSAPMGAPSGGDEADVAALRQRVTELELRLSETAPLPTETAATTEDFGAVHFSAPGFDEDTSAVTDHELAALHNQLAADRAAALDLPETETPEAVHFSSPFAEDPKPAADDLSFLTPGGCAHTDPLEDINGIGEVFAKRLREAGVCTFAQLARLTPAHVRRLAKVKDWQKVEPEKWIEEAAAFAHRNA